MSVLLMASWPCHFGGLLRKKRYRLRKPKGEKHPRHNWRERVEAPEREGQRQILRGKCLWPPTHNTRQNYIMKINTGILDLPSFKIRPAGQTQPISSIQCSTVQDFLAIVNTYMHAVIEWRLGDRYPFLHYSNGTRWQRRPMTAELAFTLIQCHLIETCHTDEELSKWRPVK